jgi:hypothetical protein
MPAEIQAVSSKKMLWTGRIMSALPVLLILFASSIKLAKTPSAVEGTVKMGYPASLVVPIGIIELASVVIYVIPATSVLGAILLTGLLGGATASLVRVGDPSIPLPVLTGMLVWGGLFFRDSRIRALIPLSRNGGR